MNTFEKSNQQLKEKIASLEAQLEIEKNKNRFIDKVWDATMDGMVICNKEGIIIKANRRFFATYGYEQKEIIGKSFTVILPTEFRQEAKQYYRKLFEKEDIPKFFETEIQDKNGHQKIIESRIEFLVENNKKTAILGIVKDVTQQKKANQQLKESEQKHIDFLNMLPQYVFEIDKNFRLRFLNKSAIETLGLTQKIIAQNKLKISDLIIPEDLQRIKNNIIANLKGKTTNGNEYTFQLKNGKKRIVQIFNTKVIENNQVVGLRGIAVDITRRKKAEQALLESQSRFKAFMNHFPGATFIKDKNNKLIFCNTQYAKMLNSTPEKLIGKVADENVPSNQQKQYKKENQEVVEKNKLIKTESVFPMQEKNTYWLTYKFPINTGSKKLLGALSIDISEQKNAEQALKESEERLKIKLDYILTPDDKTGDLQLNEIIDLEQLQKIQDAFANATDVASIITNLKGEPITRPSNFSPVCKLIRETPKGRQNCYRSDKITGMHAAQSQTPVYEKCHSCGFIDAGAPIIVGGKHIAIWMIGQSNLGEVNQQKIAEYAHEIGANKDKMQHAFSKMKNMSLDKFRKITHLLWIFAKEISGLAYNNLKLAQKIQQHKEFEKQLIKAKDKAEESNRLKSAFLNNISHEFRTPLNGILGFSDLITRESLSLEKRKKFADKITQSSQQLLNIVTDTIEIAEIQSNTVQVYKSDVNLKKLIEEVILNIEYKAKEKGLELISNIKCTEEESIIYSDSQKIERVINHLLDNAIKFTAKGNVELICKKNKKENINITIKDTGIGIAAQTQDIIFEPFRQAETQITRNYGGNGIGLALVKAYVELLGGKIHLHSKLNQGSSFEVILPVKTTQKTIPKTQLPNKQDTFYWPEKTILIVEKEEINSLFLKEVLSETQINILHVKNHKQALDYCKKNKHIDIILIDITMPEATSWQTIKKIRQHCTKTIIIAQTDHTLKSKTKKQHQERLNDYLVKPITHTKLFSVLKKYL